VPVYYPGTHDHRSASAIEVRAGAELNGFDLMVAPVRTGTITGTVGPLPSLGGGPLRAQLQASRNPSYNYRTTGVRIDPATGAFSIEGLAPGSYVLAAAIGTGDERLTGHRIVNVAEGETAHASVSLVRGIDIPVRIVMEGDAPAAGLQNLRVSLRTDPIVPGIADTPPARADAGGSITLQAIVPGNYLVNVTPLMTLSRAAPTPPRPAVPGPSSPGPSSLSVSGSGIGAPGAGAPRTANLSTGLEGAYVKSLRFNGVEIDGRLQIDGRRPDGPLEIVIGTNSGYLEGAAVDTSRRPAAHATVVLVPGAESRHRIDLYKVTSTNAAGRFSFEHVPPGDYTVFAWEDVESWSWLEPQFMQAHEGRGTPARIGEGAEVAVEVTVTPAR
jgi:hypothetical protein